MFLYKHPAQYLFYLFHLAIISKMIFATKILGILNNNTKSIGLAPQYPIHKVAVCGILPGNIIHLPFDGLVSEMLQFI